MCHPECMDEGSKRHTDGERNTSGSDTSGRGLLMVEFAEENQGHNALAPSNEEVAQFIAVREQSDGKHRTRSEHIQIEPGNGIWAEQGSEHRDALGIARSE